MGALDPRHRLAVEPPLIHPDRRGASSVIARPGSTRTKQDETTNSQHDEQQPPESPQDEITRLEIEKLRLETDLIQAGMR